MLVLADCREWLESLPRCFRVDAVITSPPYDSQRAYGPADRSWTENMSGLAGLNDCQMLINLGLVHKDGQCRLYWEPWLSTMRAAGWRLFGWYVWDQGSGLPGDWNGRLAPSHEFVFHLNKSARPANKWAATVSGARRITGTGLRGADNQTKGSFTHQGAFVQDRKVADSVIRVTREMRRDVEHPAKFPVDFPKHLASSFTDPGETILDPFMGSGTTGVACAQLGRKFIGIEIEERYFDIACERISNAYRQAPLFPEPVAKPEQEALL
jgi:DNA modification methylase